MCAWWWFSGGSLVVFGAGNVTEGSTGFYMHFSGEGSAFNPVKTAFNKIPGGYGLVLYIGVDLATSVGMGFVKVPLAMGKADGLNRPNSTFGVMVSRMDNNYFLPLTYKSTPYGAAGAIYLLGVGGKGCDFGVKLLMVKKMKINLNLTRAVLWFTTVVVVLFVWLFIVFCVCGILMSVFQVKDSLVLMVHAFFSAPLSVVCTVFFVVKKREMFSAIIDANVGR